MPARPSVLIAAVCCMMALPMGRMCFAQQEDPAEVARALDLEAAGKYREAAALFRSSIRNAPTPNSVLGLERVYAELHITDSLPALLDTLIAKQPKEFVYRTIQMRAFQMLRRDDDIRASFEKWVAAFPREAAPYREYARILIGLGQPALAETIVRRGRNALGSLRDLEFENAQLRAAMGDWVPSAQSWRRALVDAPYLAAAAAHALSRIPVTTRDSIREVFAALPVESGSRQALAELELSWGRTNEAWAALKAIRADTSAASVWEEFGDRLYADERWALAHEAFVAANEARHSRKIAIKAAAAALRSGHPGEVATLLPLQDIAAEDRAAIRQVVPLHVEALVQSGRPADAEALATKYERFETPIERLRLSQSIAGGWIRRGDLAKARAALRMAGMDADSSEAAGWLALYEGRLDDARRLLHTTTSTASEQILALGFLVRTQRPTFPELGNAFLAVARTDTASATARFVDVAAADPGLAPLALLTAARLQVARRELSIPYWTRIVAEYGSAPEAAEAELEWARYLRAKGDIAGATAHVEHLILSAPQSALLPQARHELDQLRGSTPP